MTWMSPIASNIFAFSSYSKTERLDLIQLVGRYGNLPDRLTFGSVCFGQEHQKSFSNPFAAGLL